MISLSTALAEKNLLKKKGIKLVKTSDEFQVKAKKRAENTKNA